MLDTHYSERKLSDWGTGSFVHWARVPTGKAIIFIHGFNGGPDDTFSEFDLLFRNEKKFKGYDIYFYGYQSLFQSAEVSAVEFRDFLDQIYDDSVSLFNTSVREKEKKRPKYKSICIVAHSLGAVVTRLALLSAHRKKLKWVDNVSLVLFAPAHKGTSLTLTATITGEALSGLFKFIPLASSYFILTLRELSGGSVVLSDLETKTKKLIDQGIRTFTIAKGVYWASTERIVRCTTFGEDPEGERIPNTTHTSVCKPTRKFLRPLEILVSHI